MKTGITPAQPVIGPHPASRLTILNFKLLIKTEHPFWVINPERPNTCNKMFADIRHIYEMLDQGGGAHGNGGVYFGKGAQPIL